uniref:ELMO domain-containing protein 2 n=1 Tax=Phallusia mammillata TaxID=59560 RepID=A0A6F9DB94_9ASCI|nr:ELMO domain-containing protein 2 [Phallusia mammillata]
MLQAGKKTLATFKHGPVTFLSLLYNIALIRSVIKWIIRMLTGTCQLQRILQKCESGTCTVKIEECLRRSKFQQLRRIVEVEPENLDAAVEQIMTIKQIVADTNPRFFTMLRTCLEQIHGYNKLFVEIEALRTEKYDCENEEHEKLLLKLWSLLQPDEPLTCRVSKQWGNIGFQGDDPKTDFRGMGILGLLNLVYFAEHYPEHAAKSLLHSMHPKYGYSYAIASINITSMSYELMCSGLLRSHFFNTVQGRPTTEHYHEAFCYLFYEFDKFWMKSEPENVMEFSRIRGEFMKTIQDLLAYLPTARLLMET